MFGKAGFLARRCWSFLNRNRGVTGWLLVSLVAFAVVEHNFNTAYVEIDITTSRPTQMIIYWAGEHQNYSERRATRASILPHKRHYKLPIGNLSRINRLRFDPSSGPATVRVREFSIYQYGFEPIRLRGAVDLLRIKPYRRIASHMIQRDQLELIATEPDPQTELMLDELLQPSGSVLPGELWRTLLLVGLCVLFVRILRRVSSDYIFVPYAFLAAFILISVMATSSQINAHPDEYVHLLAARYYTNHYIPPGACDASTLHTFSPYGVSRLNSTEIAYFFTGKFAQALAFLPQNEAFRLRYFNVMLFALLLLMTIRSVSFRLVSLPLLFTPQVWYLFSYVNSEGLAIFATMVAVHQLVSADSTLRRIMASTTRRRSMLSLIGLGVLLAVLLLLKQNFHVFGLFVALWLLLLLLMRKDWRPATQARRLAPMFAVATILAGTWLYLHAAANDFNRVGRITECAERMAAPGYSTTIDTTASRPTLYWRDKGYPITRLFEQRWGTKVFYSSVGHFGYLELLGPPTYYVIFAVLLVLLSAYLVIAVIRRGDTLQRCTIALGFATLMLILGLMIWKAWTRDFQPQGRYLAPMLPVLALMIACAGRTIDKRIITALVLALFAMSAYFFIFVGLPGIRKY